MKDFVRIPLRTKIGRRFHYDRLSIETDKEELQKLLEENDYMQNKAFAERILETDNNKKVEQFINERKTITNEKKERLINMYNAYRYIKVNKEINKETLRKLYSILSNNVLKETDIETMGQYYRNSREFFSNGPRLQDTFEIGIKPKKLEKYMNKLLDYINYQDSDSEIENFIKLQKMLA